jgi:hypothetical protein
MHEARFCSLKKPRCAPAESSAMPCGVHPSSGAEPVSQSSELAEDDMRDLLGVALPRWPAATALSCAASVSFGVNNRPVRPGRNPRTGAQISVEKKTVPFFRTGKEMRERAQSHADDRDDAALYVLALISRLGGLHDIGRS